MPSNSKEYSRKYWRLYAQRCGMVECEFCGKTVQKVNLRKHQKGKRCMKVRINKEEENKTQPITNDKDNTLEKLKRIKAIKEQFNKLQEELTKLLEEK